MTWKPRHILKPGLASSPNYESDYQPQRWRLSRSAKNRFEKCFVQGSNIGLEITQDNGNNGSYSGTSLMEVTNIASVNFTDYTSGGKDNRTASISCSKVHPCYNVSLRNISLASSANGTEYPAQGTCSYISPRV